MPQNTQDDDLQKQILEAMEVSGKIKTELAQIKAQNDYLEKIVNKLEQVVLGSR
jgi:hypothetical protein